MKLIALICLFALPAAAQTYVNFKLFDFDATHHASVEFDVPTNTIFKEEALTDPIMSDNLYVQYPEATNWVALLTADSSYGINYPKVLGPAKIQFQAYSPDAVPQVLLASFTPVNTTPALSGYGVQPNGRAATVALETSADLKTWQVATNGTYPATNAAAFYRINFQVN
jgi:hypothetical protein